MGSEERKGEGEHMPTIIDTRIEEGDAGSKAQAKRLIAQGVVRVNGVVATVMEMEAPPTCCVLQGGQRRRKTRRQRADTIV